MFYVYKTVTSLSEPFKVSLFHNCTSISKQYGHLLHLCCPWAPNLLYCRHFSSPTHFPEFFFNMYVAQQFSTLTIASLACLVIYQPVVGLTAVRPFAFYIPYLYLILPIRGVKDSPEPKAGVHTGHQSWAMGGNQLIMGKPFELHTKKVPRIDTGTSCCGQHC